MIYVGTGEGALRNTITNGNGIHKSVDSGESWTHIGLSDTRQIDALIVDQRNPDIVLSAQYSVYPKLGRFCRISRLGEAMHHMNETGRK